MSDQPPITLTPEQAITMMAREIVRLNTEIARLTAGLKDVYQYAYTEWPEADGITDKIEELLK